MNARDALAHFLDAKGSDRLLCNGFRYDPNPVVRATPGIEDIPQGQWRNVRKVLDEWSPS